MTRAAPAYTRTVLAWYDLFVLGAVCPVVWRCHRGEMLACYDRNVGPRHLDLGPGTGYFLDRCRFPAAPRLVLVDNSETVLATAARRVARHRPLALRRDVLGPLDLGSAQFDSVGMNFLLHCLPGGMAAKAAVFDRVLPHLAPGARIFGSTVLAHGVEHGPLAGRALASLNGDGTMDNLDDSLDELDAELASRFDRYHLAVRGSVCLFEIST
ncbi:class I SAM-dependent methyltransferase [Actinokineospora sp. NPDC004072]